MSETKTRSYKAEKVLERMGQKLNLLASFAVLFRTEPGSSSFLRISAAIQGAG